MMRIWLMKMDGFNIQTKSESRLFDYRDFSNDPEGLMFVKNAEKDFYNEVLDRVINNPRFYLDNLDKLAVFDTCFLRKSVKKGKV